MNEQMAKAMFEACDALSDRWQWSSMHGQDRAYWLEAARVAREAMTQEVEEHSEPSYVAHMTSAHRRAWRRGNRFALGIIREGR